MNTRAACYETLNHFFVSTFNRILAWEERSMRAAGLADLSVKELHVLEAAHDLAPKRLNTMSQIAARMDRSLWLLGDRVEPDYGGRPWTLWTANSALRTEASDLPVRWVVYQP